MKPGEGMYEMPVDAIQRKKIMKQLNGSCMTISGPGYTNFMTDAARGVDPNNPFKSEKQRKFLYANKPSVAKKFAKHSMKKEPMMSKKEMKSSMRGY